MSTAAVPVVYGAGALVWRHGLAGIELAVIYRSRYGDWSLPKGKLKPGETIPETVVREVREETGLSIALGPWLAEVAYPIRTRKERPATKLVTYLAAKAIGGRFIPHKEVSELRWLSSRQAHDLLSYSHDQNLVAHFSSIVADSQTLLLIRHAKAGSREKWSGDDVLRPLSRAGQRQATVLAGMLGAFTPTRLYAALPLRCVQTIQPLADRIDQPIQLESGLSESNFRRNPTFGVARLQEITTEPGVAIVCSQGTVIPTLVSQIALDSGIVLPAVESHKGSVWQLSFSNNGSHLIAAHYWGIPSVNSVKPN